MFGIEGLSPLIVALIAFVVGVVVAVGIAVLVKFLASGEQGYPMEGVIEAAIIPFLYNAIMLAFKESEASFDKFGQILDGVDKKILADKVYNLLPEHLKVGQYMVPLAFIKSVITEERFAMMVQQAYDGFSAWYNETWEKYGDELREWVPSDG